MNMGVYHHCYWGYIIVILFGRTVDEILSRFSSTVITSRLVLFQDLKSHYLFETDSASRNSKNYFLNFSILGLTRICVSQPDFDAV